MPDVSDTKDFIQVYSSINDQVSDHAHKAYYGKADVFCIFSTQNWFFIVNGKYECYQCAGKATKARQNLQTDLKLISTSIPFSDKVKVSIA